MLARSKLEARRGFHMTWVAQFCSVVGLDDVDGLLAGCDFIGPIVYVFAKDLILYMATEGRFQRIHWIPGKKKNMEHPGQWGELERGCKDWDNMSIKTLQNQAIHSLVN